MFKVDDFAVNCDYSMWTCNVNIRKLCFKANGEIFVAICSYQASRDCIGALGDFQKRLFSYETMKNIFMYSWWVFMDVFM